VADFISEWWPASFRNSGRLQIGIHGRLPSESSILIIDPEFESLCPDVLMAACLADSDPGACPGSNGRL
jgi:hypothetical protein